MSFINRLNFLFYVELTNYIDERKCIIYAMLWVKWSKKIEQNVRRWLLSLPMYMINLFFVQIIQFTSFRCWQSSRWCRDSSSGCTTGTCTASLQRDSEESSNWRWRGEWGGEEEGRGGEEGREGEGGGGGGVGEE